jgi:putative transposase
VGRMASLLDLDLLPVYDSKSNDSEKPTFSGKRVKRGLYRASDGRKINADINGAGNIIRKVAPDAFSEAEGVEDGKAGILHSLVVHPVRIVVPRRTRKASNGVSKRSRERYKTL